jgi:sensor c-di-GMP phosphodiesterase-like protein
MEEATLAAELRRILDRGLVRSIYQPIVDLDSEEIVAYEALGRKARCWNALICCSPQPAPPATSRRSTRRAAPRR